MKPEELIRCLQNGKSTEAIRQLYETFPPIRNFILQNGGSQDDARDIFQESLLILCQNVLKPDFHLSCMPGTYLYSICKYLWKDVLKKRNRSQGLEPEMHKTVEVQSDVEAYEKKEMEMKMLDKVLNQVGEKCLDLLKSYYFDRNSMKKIAKEFGFASENSAKTQKYKCLQRAKVLASKLTSQPQTSQL